MNSLPSGVSHSARGGVENPGVPVNNKVYSTCNISKKETEKRLDEWENKENLFPKECNVFERPKCGVSDASCATPIVKNLENMLRAGNQVFHIQVKIPGIGENDQDKQIQQVIVVDAAENADKAISQAVSEITKRLNNEAAQKLANGIRPEKETVIEITRIANPAESRNCNLPTRNESNPLQNNKEDFVRDVQSCGDNPLNATGPYQAPTRTCHNRRKSPPKLRYMDRFNPQVGYPYKPPTIISSQDLFKDRFRNSSAPPPRVRAIPVTMSNSFFPSPATNMTAAMKLGIGSNIHVQNRVHLLPSNNPRNLRMVFSHPGNAVNPAAIPVRNAQPPGMSYTSSISSASAMHLTNISAKRSIAILNRSRSSSSSMQRASVPSSDTYSENQTRSVVESKTYNEEENNGMSSENPINIEVDDQTLSNSQKSDRSSVSMDSTDLLSNDGDESVPEDANMMNDSLTNIQWLGSMKGETLQSNSNKDLRLIASEKQIEKVNKECGKNKRPPYSYMHLIQMAICSKADRKMTLKDIYTWIEHKFPYYKCNPNKGWRNSIRHNLSLYDIFVREKTHGFSQSSQNKATTSLWTLRADVKAKPYNPDDTCSTIDELNDSVFACESSISSTDSPALGAPPGTPLSSCGCLGGSGADASRSLATPTPPPLLQSDPGDKKGVAKKKPVPLLPKPSSSQPQTYALIPIQGGVPVVPRQPILVPANWNGNSPYPMLEMNNARPLKRCASSPLPSAVGGPLKKQIRIAPKLAARPDAPPPYPYAVPAATSCTAMNSACAPYLQRSTIATLSNSIPVPRPNALQPNPFALRHRIPDPMVTHVQQITSVQNGGFRAHGRSQSFSVGANLASQSYDSGLGSSLPGAVDSSTEISASDLRHVQLGENSHCRNDTTAEDDILDADENLVFLNNSNFSESGINDILASIEQDLDSPVKKLLQTPTKDAGKSTDNLLTSTPVKLGQVNTSWISPIRCFASPESMGLQASFLNSPPFVLGDDKATGVYQQSSQSGTDQEDNKLGLKISSVFALSSPRQQRESSPKSSPNLGSLRSFGLAGLTPMKSQSLAHAQSAQVGQSPALSTGDDNQSFGKLLGELHLDSMLDDGINLDVSNMSFSHIKCDF